MLPKLILLTVIGIVIASGPSAHALTLLGQPVNCDPTKAPTGGGCGISHLVGLVSSVINWLWDIVVPLAILMVMVGGFYIMTAGGSEENVRKGKSFITAAVVGVIIAISAKLIVDFIYRLLTGTDLP
jgi:hypothetical protein